MHAVDGVPGRILEAVIDRRPGRNEINVDRLHPLAGDQTQRGVARRGDQIEAAFIHQRHHLVGCVGGLDVDLAARGFLEFGDPVKSLVGFAAFKVAGPGDNVDLAFAGSNFSHHIRRGNSRGHDRKRHRHGRTCVQDLFHLLELPPLVAAKIATSVGSQE